MKFARNRTNELETYDDQVMMSLYWCVTGLGSECVDERPKLSRWRVSTELAVDIRKWEVQQKQRGSDITYALEK